MKKRTRFKLRKKVSDQQISEIGRLYSSGLGSTELSRIYGVSNDIILKYVRQQGIQIRTNAESKYAYRKTEPKPALFCEKCGKEIPNRNDRTTMLCLECSRKNRCPDCARLLSPNKPHTCISIDKRGDRHCLDCGKVLSNQGYERWKNRCNSCANKRAKIQEQKAKKKLKAKFGNKCQICGYDRCFAALHFHHVIPDHKYEYSKKGHLSVREIKEHPERFMLVCANCHYEIHDRERKIKHKTLSQ